MKVRKRDIRKARQASQKEKQPKSVSSKKKSAKR
jgi:hypothetical protein